MKILPATLFFSSVANLTQIFQLWLDRRPDSLLGKKTKIFLLISEYPGLGLIKQQKSNMCVTCVFRVSQHLELPEQSLFRSRYLKRM